MCARTVQTPYEVFNPPKKPSFWPFVISFVLVVLLFFIFALSAPHLSETAEIIMFLLCFWLFWGYWFALVKFLGKRISMDIGPVEIGPIGIRVKGELKQWHQIKDIELIASSNHAPLMLFWLKRSMIAEPWLDMRASCYDEKTWKAILCCIQKYHNVVSIKEK